MTDIKQSMWEGGLLGGRAPPTVGSAVSGDCFWVIQETKLKSHGKQVRKRCLLRGLCVFSCL